MAFGRGGVVIAALVLVLFAVGVRPLPAQHAESARDMRLVGQDA